MIELKLSPVENFSMRYSFVGSLIIIIADSLQVLNDPLNITNKTTYKEKQMDALNLLQLGIVIVKSYKCYITYEVTYNPNLMPSLFQHIIGTSLNGELKFQMFVRVSHVPFISHLICSLVAFQPSTIIFLHMKISK